MSNWYGNIAHFVLQLRSDVSQLSFHSAALQSGTLRAVDVTTVAGSACSDVLFTRAERRQKGEKEGAVCDWCKTARWPHTWMNSKRSPTKFYHSGCQCRRQWTCGWSCCWRVWLAIARQWLLVSLVHEADACLVWQLTAWHLFFCVWHFSILCCNFAMFAVILWVLFC